MTMADLIVDLGAWLSDTSIDELQLTGPEGSIRLVRRQDGSVSEATAALPGPLASDHTCIVRATSPGIFLDRHPVGVDPPAEPGAVVGPGDHIGYLRLGLLVVPVTAPVAGHLVSVLAERHQVVGYGAPLVDIEPADSPEA